MDRRSLVIILVVGIELILRLLYRPLSLPVDPLLYTAAARLIQTGLILFLAFDLCGVRARSLPREVLVGIGVSLLFGAVVVLVDLASRLVLQGGVLKLLLSRQHVESPALFFLVGCVLGPFAEELFFRGLFYSWLRERLPVLGTIVLSALFFASLHAGGFPVQLIGGLLFASLFEWRNSIWAPFVVHAAANTGIWILPFIYP
ncbi:MAG TPA: type II CAAX endopeptidase family protein [Deltaproteobacteria bacterium]|jgi:hypothetical protein|nr:type II CAAX endopeptidase family protein [Deltaproteobacteria bacterium]HOI08518.1 type II CAAX endopeptidase family protein [Deltaproteobacteria bacterium]